MCKNTIEALLALRGKINIEYDWELEEESELKAAEEREGLSPAWGICRQRSRFLLIGGMLKRLIRESAK